MVDPVSAECYAAILERQADEKRHAKVRGGLWVLWRSAGLLVGAKRGMIGSRAPHSVLDAWVQTARLRRQPITGRYFLSIHDFMPRRAPGQFA